MKEVVAATPQQSNYLIQINNCITAAAFNRKTVEETGQDPVEIRNPIGQVIYVASKKLARTLEFGAWSLVNELVHPLEDTGQRDENGMTIWKRTTNEDMKKVVDEVIKEAV